MSATLSGPSFIIRKDFWKLYLNKTMMIPRKNNTLIDKYLEEIDKMTVSDEIKTVVKNLVIQNQCVSRQLCCLLKSLDNQSDVVKYLERTLKERMAGYSKEILKTLTEIGAETLRSVNNFARYQMLACELLNSYPLKQISQEQLIVDFRKAVFAVPAQYLEASRHFFIDVLSKLKDGGYDDTFHKLDNYEFGDTTEIKVAEPKASTQRTNGTEHRRIKNNKLNDFKRNKKESYRIMAKRNACRTSRKHSLKNLQSNKTQSTSRKKFAYPDNEEVQSQRFSGRRKYKRKFEEVNDKSLNSDDEASFAVYKSSARRKTRLAKKTRSSYYSIYTSEPVTLRHCSVELNDFMLDSSADNDPFIAQYKQSCGYKVHEQVEIVTLEEASDDTDSDQRDETISDDDNDGNDNLDDRISTKSHESDDNDLEEDANASKLIDSENHDDEASNNSLSNGKKGPCTPPHSPAPDDFNVRWGPRTPDNIRRGPRTPSYSPPVVPRRGPCTPPGAAPTSDSEAIDDEGASSDSSGL